MSDRLQDIKNMVEAMDGDLTLYLFGYEMKSESVVNDLKWLIEQAELLQSHAPEGRNYTNAQYVQLLQEKEKIEEERAYWKIKYRDLVALDEDQE